MVMAIDKCFCGLLFCMLLSFAFIEAIQEGALITNLPGFNGAFPSKHYSGYVTIDEKNLFYYFVVSERNSSNDPVVLWLNGGPGCSSFDGFVYEHGPFNFEAGQPKGSLPILHLNPYSWSKVFSDQFTFQLRLSFLPNDLKGVPPHRPDVFRRINSPGTTLSLTLGVSNIIYLDSPTGVGLSYSQNTSNYITGDLQTAADTHAFLLKWFELYPEFVSNPFYIAGESFAGVYVPTLSSEVVKGIKAGAKPTINFKGYLVGNGVTDVKFDSNALVPFAHGMGLISNDIFEDVQAACKGNYSNPDDNCFISLQKVDRALAGLNIYNILEPCYHGQGSKQDAKGNTSLPISFQQLGATEKPLPVRKRMFGRAWPLWTPVKDGIVTLWPELDVKFHVPCVNDEVATTWLNDAAVRKAIHAEPDSVAGPWEICAGRISYRHDAGSMIPYHKNLTAQGYRAIIYSGDHDLCVPFTGSQAWTRSLGYNITDEWRSWLSNEEVAGYLQGYDHNLTFLTVKGAGHTVPEYKPLEALDFYSRWLDGKPI